MFPKTGRPLPIHLLQLMQERDEWNQPDHPGLINARQLRQLAPQTPALKNPNKTLLRTFFSLEGAVDEP